MVLVWVCLIYNILIESFYSYKYLYTFKLIKSNQQKYATKLIKSNKL